MMMTIVQIVLVIKTFKMFGKVKKKERKIFIH